MERRKPRSVTGKGRKGNDFELSKTLARRKLECDINIANRSENPMDLTFQLIDVDRWSCELCWIKFAVIKVPSTLCTMRLCTAHLQIYTAVAHHVIFRFHVQIPMSSRNFLSIESRPAPTARIQMLNNCELSALYHWEVKVRRSRNRRHPN